MSALITPQYLKEQEALHAKGDYGLMGERYGSVVGALMRSSGALSLLDYGCGSRRSLLKTLDLPEGAVYEGYDPAVPEYAEPPVPADLVCCIDVLEHIEPQLLDNVLDHLASLCDPFGFFTIHTGPAAKVLSDGRNAHLTQQGLGWWMPKLEARFEVLDHRAVQQGFCVLVKQRGSERATPPHIAAPLGALGAATGAPAGTPASGRAPSVGLKHRGVLMTFATPNETTAYRVKSFYKKEPHTVAWLESMPERSVLVDIGANVGMYSIFAAKVRTATVIAFEPEAQNYALLNTNIVANQLSSQVVAFPIALSDTLALDRLYLSELKAGGSCHSFGEPVGFDLKPMHAKFAQGSVSMTLDQLIESGALPVPDYIKLDVDGFEHKVLQGAQATLRNPKVMSVLVELNTRLPEHRQALEQLLGLGFSYDERQLQAALRSEGDFKGVGEVIFTRGRSALAVWGSVERSGPVPLPASAKGRHVLNHLLRRVASTEVVQEPFPHIVVDDVFEPDYYQQMRDNFPVTDTMTPLAEAGRLQRGGVINKAMYPERLSILFTDEQLARLTPNQEAFWRQLADWLYSDQFVQGFITKFSAALEPRLERVIEAEGEVKARGDALLVNDRTNYAIGPHTDAPHRLISFLFYLPADRSMKDLGTSLYRHQDPNFTCWEGKHYPFDNFKRVTTVDFIPNRLVAFPKTERAFHGVERIARENINRPLLIHNIRLINSTLR